MAKTAFGMETTDELAGEMDQLLQTEGMEFVTIDKSYNQGDFFIPGEHADVSVISDSSVDKDFEVIDIKSIDWSSFRKNPVVLFNHKSEEVPVGKSVWQHLIEGKLWKAKTVYAFRPEGYPVENEWFPDTVFDLIKNGFLLGKSIGGLCKKSAPTQEEMELYPTWKSGVKVLRNIRVCEYSVVPIASNNNAVVEVVSKGLVTLKEETIKAKFPELYPVYMDSVSSQQPVIPVIKNYKTLDQYNSELIARLRGELNGIHNSVPEIVENALATMLGRV